jgi:hypothetical protein
MTQSSSLSPLGRLVSLAYAGTDMPVHIVCQSDTGALTPWELDYPTFNRLLRERADRQSAILLLEAFRQCRPVDSNTGLRRWSLIQVRRILGQGLRLDPQTVSASPLQCAA